MKQERSDIYIFKAEKHRKHKSIKYLPSISATTKNRKNYVLYVDGKSFAVDSNLDFYLSFKLDLD